LLFIPVHIEAAFSAASLLMARLCDSRASAAAAGIHRYLVACVAVAWQLAAEVIAPLNRQGGSSAGFRAQLLFFLDDLIPRLFDKPLLSDKPDRSLIAWQ
jgi:hypothetical protein